MRISDKNVNSRRTESDQCTPSQRAQETNGRLKLPKSSRILKRHRFKAIGAARNRHFGKILTIDYCPSTEPKLGITVVRQFGSSPLRNRFKRLVREAFRQNRSSLPAVEMVVMPKRGATDFSLNQIIAELLEFQYVPQSGAKPSC